MGTIQALLFGRRDRRQRLPHRSARGGDELLIGVGLAGRILTSKGSQPELGRVGDTL